MISATFIEKPTSYSYFPLNNGMADIFIRIFDHEEIDGEGNTKKRKDGVYQCSRI